MKPFRRLALASLCCAVCGVLMAGCGKQDESKPDPNDPGRGLSVQARKSKRGED